MTTIRCRICARRTLAGAPCPRHPAEPGACAERIAEPGIAESERGSLHVVRGFGDCKLLGVGGFAAVLSAVRSDGRRVAIKIAHARGDPRFEREAAALEQIGPPRVPALLGRGRTEDGHPYLVMELVGGESLAGWMARRRDAVPSSVDAVRMLAELAGVLDAVHAAGVVHRDATPENVIVGKDGRCTLIDLGLATGEAVSTAAPDLTQVGERIGTTFYAAPEQLRGEADVGMAADRYALAVIAFELLSGRPPFVGSPSEVARGHLTLRPPKLSEVSGLPVALNPVIERGLAKQPERRYPSAQAMADSVASALERRVAAASAVTARHDPARSGPRPMALAVVSGPAPFDEIEAAVAGCKGNVVKSGGFGTIVAFPWALSAAAGVRAAISATERLRAHGCSAVVHVARLKLRGRRRLMLTGEAIDGLDWLPSEPHDAPVLLTVEAASVMGESVTTPSLVGGFFVPATELPPERAGLPPLRGRDRLLRRLLREADASLLRSLPGISTIVAERGRGTSRLLAEVAARLTTRDDVQLLAVATGAHTERVVAQLARAAFGLGADVRDPERVRARVRDRVADPAVVEAAWPAVARVLSILSEEEFEDASSLAGPAAVRQTLAMAIGTALRHRAAERPLAVLIDDLEVADFTSLDALEIATLAESRSPIWILAAAGPQLASLRKTWGTRAGSAHTHELVPLDDGAARAMVRDLLWPAEYVPERTVSQVAELAERVPGQIAESVALIRSAGALRRRTGTGSWSLDDEKLGWLAAMHPADRLAAQLVETLLPDLRGLVELCSVLGETVDVRDVEGVQERLDPALSVARLDPEAALAGLTWRGILAASGARRHRFVQPLVARSLEAQIEPSRALAMHAAALEWLEASGASVLERPRMAVHAARSGNAARAAGLFLELAEAARAEGRYVEANQHYDAVLEQVGDGAAGLRQQALRGRALMRGTLGRHDSAVDDLDRAIALAEQRGDRAGVAALVLERATTLDWSYRIAESTHDAERALELSSGLDDPRLEVRCQMAVARTYWRQERAGETLEMCDRAILRARELGERETEVVLLTMEALALVWNDQLGDAESSFEAVIDLCQRRGDRHHLAANYSNRIMLWSNRQDHARASEDARRVVALSRELGNFQLERVANHNLGELLLWMGEFDEALRSARRGRELQLRFGDDPDGPWDPLLLARIHAAMGNAREARECLSWISDPRGAGLPPSHLAAHDAVELACRNSDSADAWSAVVDRAAAITLVDMTLEILHLCAVTCARAGARPMAREACRRAMALRPGTGWRSRFEALELGPRRGRAA